MAASVPILEFTKAGIYCPAGDFYIDPWLPVPRAVITHAHSDHARPGMGAYLSTRGTRAALEIRLGSDRSYQTLDWGKRKKIGGAEVSFHPSGHLRGAAQVRVEVKGQVWVASGDYKVEPDGISEPFEPVRCHTFISECTFGLPVFDWEAQEKIAQSILTWARQLAAEGRHSILFAYSLGKAQRLLGMLGSEAGPIWVHPTIAALNLSLEAEGLILPAWKTLPTDRSALPPGSLIVVPPMLSDERYLNRLGPHQTGYCSGWMAIRGFRNRGQADRGFVVSDHADWKGLLQAVAETKAETIIATHGYTEVFARFMREEWKLKSFAAETRFSGEEPNETQNQTEQDDTTGTPDIGTEG